jgi:DNA-binding NarL/FixJ family response regulator
MSALSTTDKTEVWLIEDNEVFRTMSARLINDTDIALCTRTFSTCEEALAALKAGTAPQIIISDVGLPGMNGIEGIRRIKEISPETHVIILTVYDDAQKVFDAVCAGASGYLLKNALGGALPGALQDVLQGGSPMNPRVARMVLERFARLSTGPKKDYGLTDREKETLEMMARGLIIKQIAEQLSISYHTVNTHLRNIYEKLHVNTRGAAVAKALNEKLF